MFKLSTLRCMGFKRLDIPEPIEFPQGRLLIQGRNESGKSTVMEAIHYALYGMPLRPNKKASNEDLIKYGHSSAVVELGFKVDDDAYTVKRTLRLKRGNRHELVIERSDGEKERITGARNVNQTIKRELHGIDSDALLNSCLVEQKELGKLESASRQDRIRAVTSLLNLEAFVDAQQELNRSQPGLDRENQETAHKLEKAEHAKAQFAEAELRKGQAEERITAIDGEASILSRRLEELEGVLKIISAMKELVNEIKAKENLLQGTRGELKQVEKSFDEAREAEQQIATFEEKLPQAQMELVEATKKLEALETLIKLENRLINAKKEVERAHERLEEARGKVDESKKAQSRMGALDVEIEEREPVKIASDSLPGLEENVQRFISLKSEAERLENEKASLRERLDALEDSKTRVQRLENIESQLQEEKTSLTRNRNIGFGMLFLGSILSVAAYIHVILLVIGLPLIILGAIIVTRSSSSKLDAQFQQARLERDKHLGEISRLDDFKGEQERITQESNENRILLEKAESGLIEKIAELPGKPREYGELYSREDSPRLFLSSLREAVQTDLQSLAEVSAERRETSKIADELEAREQALMKVDISHSDAVSTVESTERSRREMENEYGVNLEGEDEIRMSRDTQLRKAQELELQLENAREKASQKQSLEARCIEIRGTMDVLESQIREGTAERTRLQSQISYDMGDEETLLGERDDSNRSLARLETERKERVDDAEEAEKRIDENQELRDMHPALAQRHEEELFEIGSMTRAAKLLEATRDGIVAGVKGRIQSFMMQFLPALTGERYNMAQIDEGDYRIQVYDREAQRWRGKGVFSGATQDQFSLALRLAFALSTIPQSRGARPGFIFLDEPLSGFDAQRRDGLLSLLKGDLARYFDQIIVISHLEELRGEFPAHLQMEDGRVIG